MGAGGAVATCRRCVCGSEGAMREGRVWIRALVLARGMADICAGDLVLLLCLHPKSWCIEARTVNTRDVCPHASRWMLRVVQAGLDKV